MESVCSDFRPYSLSTYTKHLGCANCGHLAHLHKDICHKCHGTGREDVAQHVSTLNKANESNGEYEVEKACADCAGTGRQSCKNAFDLK